MEIVVKRIAKKNTYTIGRLAERYFCDTLEPTWRNLLGVELSPQEVNVRLGRVSGKKAQKMKGVTAIPEGTYPLLITHSPSFKLWLPYVQGVPGFEGIRIPAGNYPDDTQGCILVGENRVPGMGGGLPHLASPPGERHQRGEGARRRGVDYHPVIILLFQLEQCHFQCRTFAVAFHLDGNKLLVLLEYEIHFVVSFSPIIYLQAKNESLA